MYEAVALLAFLAYAASVAIRYPSLPAKVPQYFNPSNGQAAYWPKWCMWIAVALVGVIDALTYSGVLSSARAHPNTSWLAVTVLTLFAVWTTRIQGDVAVGKRDRPVMWVSWVFLAAYFVTVALGPRIIG